MNQAVTAEPGSPPEEPRRLPLQSGASRDQDPAGLRKRCQKYCAEAAGLRVKNKELKARNTELVGLVEEWRAIALENLLALRRLGGSTNG